MNRTSISVACRKLLQAVSREETILAIPDASFSPITTGDDAGRPFSPSTPFDASIALSILVLVTAFFFLLFFSFYIRRFETDAEEEAGASISTSRRWRRRRPLAASGKGGGLDASAINSLPTVAYGDGAAAMSIVVVDECAICLGEFRERERVKIIPYCGHVFHPGCVDTWLASHVTCPLCRSRQLFRSAERERLEATGGEGEGEGQVTVGGGAWGRGGGDGVRRTCSFPNLGNRDVVLLERSRSL